MSILQDIAAHTRQVVTQRKLAHPLSDWNQTVQPCAAEQLENAFRAQNRLVKLMLEIKPASPSAGVLKEVLDVGRYVEAYSQYGVGISVLTDEKYFGGSVALLETVAVQSKLPVLCKDFILDAYQVYEARRAGAAAVLLIVKLLSELELVQLTCLCRELGMTPLIEVQNEAECQKAMAAQPSILLINNRNLDTLAIDLNTTPILSACIPEGILRVAASGISTPEQIEALLPHCDGFLVGSALMSLSEEELVPQLEKLTKAVHARPAH